jgi:hypothetical protein
MRYNDDETFQNLTERLEKHYSIEPNSPRFKVIFKKTGNQFRAGSGKTVFANRGAAINSLRQCIKVYPTYVYSETEKTKNGYAVLIGFKHPSKPHILLSIDEWKELVEGTIQRVLTESIEIVSV